MALFAWHDAISHWSVIVEAPTLDIARIRTVAVIRTSSAPNREQKSALLLAVYATPPQIVEAHP
jgi:hypothetical protein